MLIKVAVRDLSAPTLVFARTTIGAVVLLPIAVHRGQLRPLLARWHWLLLYTVLEIGGPWLLLSDAEHRLSSSLTGLLVAAVPLIGPVLARLAGEAERLTAGRLFGLVVGVGGVATLLGLDVGRGDLSAVAEMAGVVIGYAAGPFVLARRLADLPSLGVVAASVAICALAYLPVGVVQLPAHWPNARVVASVVVLGVVCTAAAFMFFFELIGEVGPVRSTVITYLNPAVAVTLGVVFLGERFTVGTALGFVLVLTGSFFATGGVRRSAATPV